MSWRKVKDTDLRHVWIGDSDQDVVIPPTYYEEYGTPVDADTGDDMSYSHTEIRAEFDDGWFDIRTHHLIGDFRLSGSRWIVGCIKESNPVHDALFIKHEDSAEATYMNKAECDLLIAALICAQKELGE